MIHQYKNNGYNIVLDVNSGSVHVVDDCVYDAIPLVEKILRKNLSKEETLTEAIKACKALPYPLTIVLVGAYVPLMS